MKTDWNLIRKMINAAVDACEQIEAAGYCEADRDVTTNVRGQDVSVFEFLIRSCGRIESRQTFKIPSLNQV